MIKSTAAFVYLVLALLVPTNAINLEDRPTLSDDEVQYMFENPRYATAARYQLTDDAGNSMDSMSIIQLSNKAYKYAAVYHTPHSQGGGGYDYYGNPVGGGQLYFTIDLALSNDLTNWAHQGVLVNNAYMPKVARVPNSDWIVVTDEQFQGGLTTSPTQVAFELFYSTDDFLALNVGASALMPAHQSNNNGKPSIFEFHQADRDGLISVDGQYGFDLAQGTRSVDGVTTIYGLFDPTGNTVFQPSTAVNYNNLLTASGASSYIGGCDTLITTNNRYLIQEGAIGQSGDGNFAESRVWLYKFSEPYNYPDGSGSFTALSPQTSGGSFSYGGPSVTIVDNPSGSGKVMVIYYFLYGEGAGPGEAGGLIYYFAL